MKTAELAYDELIAALTRGELSGEDPRPEDALPAVRSGDSRNSAAEDGSAFEPSTFCEESPSREPKPLGRKNDLGELMLTLEDLPELEDRLRLSGWKVERRGCQLICRSGRKARVQ